MRNFLFKITLFSLPIFIFLITVNYFGDAARIFDNDYEKQMAQIISEGYYVTNFDNFDERNFQKELILKENISPNLVIIGSSKTMLLNSDLFPGYVLLNNSVSGASIEDIIGIYQIYLENKKLPKRIIIGIDPWTFNKNNGQIRWHSIQDYYHRFTKTKYYKNALLYKYKELFSLSYFKSSFQVFIRQLSQNSSPIPTNSKFNIKQTRLTDASLVYDEKFRLASELIVKENIASYLSGDLYSIESFNEISEHIWNDFEKLITEIKFNHIEIEFFLTPYPTLVYSKVEKEYPMVIETEKKLIEFALKNNIKIYGSFNPNTLGLDDSFFYDGMHCNLLGIKRIIDFSK